MKGGFFKRPKANGFCLIRDKSYGLGTQVLAKWEALWRKFFYKDEKYSPTNELYALAIS